MSRDRKRQLNWYQANDNEAVARHLERMAARGWLLEKAGNWGWTYRRAEPAQVRYCVTFFPDASVFDPALTRGQETYIDYCAAAGWEFVSAYGPVQYFRSTRPDPVPIETDEAAKLAVIHRTMKKTMIPSYLLLLFAQCLSLHTRWESFHWRPMSVLSSPSALAMWLLLASLILYLVGNLTDYFIWYFRSKRSVARGGACLPVHTRVRMWASNLLLAVCVVSVLGYVSDVIAAPGWLWILLYSFGGIFLLIAVLQLVMNRMKRQGSARGDTRTAYIVLTIVLALVYTFCAFPLTSHLSSSGALERSPASTYTDGHGLEWDIYQDDLPVRLEDLGFAVGAGDHCTYEAETSRTPLARHAVFSQDALGDGSRLPRLSYQVCVIPWRWLRELCCETLLESSYREYMPYAPAVTPAPEEAWSSDRSGGCQYVLLYGDRILVVSGGWPMEEAQLATLVHSLLTL